MDSARARLARLPDQDLEQRLLGLGTAMSWPKTPDLHFPPALPPRRSRLTPLKLRFLAAATVFVFLFGAALALSGEFRHTVAGVFGVDGIDIVIRNDDQTAPALSPIAPLSELVVGRPVEFADAPDLVDFVPMFPAELGRPAELYLRELPGGELMLTAVYPANATIPETAETGVGLLLMQFVAGGEVPMLVKGISGSFSALAEVAIGESMGIWLEGVSDLTVPSDPSAGAEAFLTRPTANVLLWQRDGVTYRMESSLSLIEAAEIARSMTTPEQLER